MTTVCGGHGRPGIFGSLPVSIVAAISVIFTCRALGDAEKTATDGQTLLKGIASQQMLFRTLHVRYQETHSYQDDAGRAIPSETGVPSVFRGQWARDENGAVAFEQIQLGADSRRTTRLSNAYYVNKDGKRLCHLDRDASGSSGYGVITKGGGDGGIEVIGTNYVLPWIYMPQGGANFDVQDEYRDGRRMYRISWQRGNDRMLVLADIDRSMMPILIERRSSDGRLIGSREVLESIEVGDGLWLPTRQIMRSEKSKDAPQEATQDICEFITEPLAVNGPLDPHLFEPTWKPGMEVYDRTLQKSFIVLDQATLAASGGDRGVDEALLAIHQGRQQREDYKNGTCSSAPTTRPGGSANATPRPQTPSEPLGTLAPRQKLWLWGGAAAVFVVFVVIGLCWRRSKAGPRVGP